MAVELQRYAKSLSYAWLLLRYPAIGLGAAACVEAPEVQTHCAALPLLKGRPADGLEADLFVDVISPTNHCTGLSIGSDTLLTAAHCIRSGLRSLSSWHGACRERKESCALDVDSAVTFVHPTLDVALIRLKGAQLDRNRTIAYLDHNHNFSDFEVLGSGVGSYAEDDTGCPSLPGERLIAAAFIKSWEDDDHFGARVTSSGSSVCAGDSGGAAIVSTEDGPRLAGILVQSESSPDGSCTPEGGFQLFVKVDAFKAWSSEYAL
jgi:hypothetical protein